MKYKRILYDEIISENQIDDLLSKKIVMIIGAGSGIGKSIAINAGRSRAKIVLVGRNIDRLRETQKKIPNSSVISCDLTVDSEVEKLLIDLEIKYRCFPNIIINSAGIRVDSDKKNNVLLTTQEEWDVVFKTNFLCNTYLIRNFDRKLKKLNIFGKYIAISSIDGTKTAETVYGLSKVCLNSYISETSQILHNCTIYGLAPGPTATQMMDPNMVFHYYRPDHPDLRCAVPQDIANLAVFLCSDRCKIKSGTIIKCDGGKSL